MLNVPGWLWPVLLTLTLMLLRGQTLVAAERENYQAVQTVSFCGGERPSVSSDTTTPKFEAVEARCQGDRARERTTWEQVLDQSGARLDVARAAWPQDVDLARLAAERYPEMAIAHFWLGDALREAGKAAGAIAAYEAGLRLAPTDALAWDKVGRLYEAAGDLEKAVRAYDRACFYVDRGKNGCLRAGRVYLELSRYEAAVARYRTALQQLPGYTAAHRGMVEALLGLGRTDEALPHLQVLADRGDAEAAKILQALQSEDR